MKAVQNIRRLGFRKWYERELLQSHAHLVLLLLCSLGLVGAAEAFTLQVPLSSQLTSMLCGAISAVIGVWALRRYLYLLNHAEYLADQAVCRECDTYARWDIVEEEPASGQMEVCCRKCGHRWRIAL